MPVTRIRTALVTVCAVVAGSLALASPAGAADAVSCSSPAPVLTVSSSGGLYSYPFLRASSSTAAFGSRTQVGTGWGVYPTVLGGPGGWVYAVKADGLWLYHRAGTRWDVQRRHFAILGAYAAGSRRNRITVDERGTIFVLDDAGAVRAYSFTPDHTGFTAMGDLVLPALSGRTLLVAAGDGVLVTRRSDGTLWRTRYEATSDRVVGTERKIGSGWNGFTRVVSLGGDVLLGVTTSGAMRHYRFREDTGSWPLAQHTVGAGWGTARSVTARSDACRLTRSYVPEPVTLGSDQTAAPATSAVGSGSGVLDALAPGTPGTLLWARYSRIGGGYQLGRLPFGDAAGTPAAGHLSDGRLTALVTSASGRMRALTQRPNQLAVGPTSDEGGVMASSPVAVQRGARITYLAVDAVGTLWAKVQDRTTGELLPWGALPVGGLAPVTPTVAGSSGDRSLLAFLTREGSVRLAWFDGLRFSGWTTADGADLVGRPAVTVYPGGADAVVAARSRDGGLVARRVALTASGVSTSWSVVPGAESTSGEPAVAMTGKGTVAVLARPTSGGGIAAFDESGPRSASWKAAVWLATSPQGTPQTDPAVATGYSWSTGNAWFAVSAGPTPNGQARTMYDASGEVP